MLNRHLIDEDSIEFNFEFMTFLIREFGAPHAPPVPSPLHKAVPIYHRMWSEDDQRSVYVWVEDELGFLKTHFHMQDWHVIARPDGDGPIGWDGDTPIIRYDARRCAEPGYFTSRVLINLADILINSRLDTDNLCENFQRQLNILTICYLGQGLTLAALPATYLVDLMQDQRLTKSEAKLVANRALFGTALALTCRRFSQEQLITTYGPIMDKPTYKKLWGGLKQLNSYETEVDVLKMLCGKGEQRPVDQALLAATG